uniref:Uncharacterized protein n=1 Tax=Arundo donax TaxID=35708 RepID=A0A0A9HRN9_ARUDO
MMGPGGIGNLF